MTNTTTPTRPTSFFRNDLTGLFYRGGEWNETDPFRADHLDETEESFLRTVWDCSNVTRFPTEREDPRPMGLGRFFQVTGEAFAH